MPEIQCAVRIGCRRESSKTRAVDIGHPQVAIVLDPAVSRLGPVKREPAAVWADRDVALRDRVQPIGGQVKLRDQGIVCARGRRNVKAVADEIDIAAVGQPGGRPCVHDAAAIEPRAALDDRTLARVEDGQLLFGDDLSRGAVVPEGQDELAVRR